MVAGEDGDTLPLAYCPEQIALFWSRRPVAVFTRIVQLLSIAGGFLSGFLWDLANGRLAQNEVAVLPVAGSCSLPYILYLTSCLAVLLFRPSRIDGASVHCMHV